jgi:murein DD-endopeptidase MepM/ murein hydrolase activator NlpD
MVKLRRDSFGKGYFGASRDGGRQHEGVDLAVDIKMPVYAAKSGRVVFAGVGKGYGKYVEISHPDGHSTRYAHLSELCCQKGDWVIRGCVIGVSGRTGNAANPKIHPHLHFEIRKQGKPLDPAEWMNPAIQMRQK